MWSTCLTSFASATFRDWAIFREEIKDPRNWLPDGLRSAPRRLNKQFEQIRASHWGWGARGGKKGVGDEISNLSRSVPFSRLRRSPSTSPAMFTTVYLLLPAVSTSFGPINVVLVTVWCNFPRFCFFFAGVLAISSGLSFVRIWWQEIASAHPFVPTMDN